MRSPLHARTAVIAVTLFLSLVLVVNITIGQHAGLLSIDTAHAGIIFGKSSSQDSLLSQAFSSVLAGSSSSYFPLGSSSPYMPPPSAYVNSSFYSVSSVYSIYPLPTFSSKSSSSYSSFDPYFYSSSSFSL